MGDHPEEKISPRLEKLERVFRDNPRTGLFLALAEEYRKLSRHEDALLVCRAGLVQFPGYASARVTLAQVLLDLGQDVDAEQELSPVLDQSPENILANRLMVRILQSRGDLSPQSACLVRLLELSPDDPEANHLKCELEELVASTEVTVGRTNGESQVSGEEGSFVTATMAELYLEQGLPDKALDVIERLIEEDPSNEQLTARKAEIAASMEDVIPSSQDPGTDGSDEERITSPTDVPNERQRKLKALNRWLEAAGRLNARDNGREL